MNQKHRLELIKIIIGKPVPGLMQVSQREVNEIAKAEFNFQPKNTVAEDENSIDMGIISGMIQE